MTLLNFAVTLAVHSATHSLFSESYGCVEWLVCLSDDILELFYFCESEI